MDQLKIIADLGEDVARRCALRVVKLLKGMNDPLLSGQDSGLVNIWEEVCVQVQLQESGEWELYEDMMEGMVEMEVKEMKWHQLVAAWLCTEAGGEWRFTEEEDREEPHVDPDVVSNWIYHEQLISMANDYTNERIREYLDNSQLS